MSRGPVVNDALPNRCPVCGGALPSQPLPNACADCGFAYDADTRVWRTHETWARLGLVYAMAGLALGLFVAVAQRIGFGQSLSPTLPLVGVLVAPAVGLLFRRIVGGRISDRFVALTPSGILVGIRTQPLLIPWDDFAQLSERRGVPRIRRRESGELVAIDDIFADADSLAAFRAAVTATARRKCRPSAQ